jgi:hypothetical protein
MTRRWFRNSHWLVALLLVATSVICFQCDTALGPGTNLLQWCALLAGIIVPPFMLFGLFVEQMAEIRPFPCFWVLMGAVVGFAVCAGCEYLLYSLAVAMAHS